MVDTRHLYYLVVVSQCETLLKASEQLHISQQAIGRALRKLEEELQVSLFDRTKNKMVLNQYGQMAVTYAKNILLQLEQMENTIRLVEKQNRIMMIGACAPRPLKDVYMHVTTLYQDITIATELNGQQELLKGLYDHSYQLIIIPERTKDKALYCQLWGKEELYVSLCHQHPLSSKKMISFHDLDGETILLYKNIGFWYDLVLSQMPHSTFIIEDNRQHFKELAARSDLVTFATDLSLDEEGNDHHRIILSISDEEAIMPFYCICLKENKEKYEELFLEL
ncbi:MAG: LysR family transcriptional regulator [Faecalibacillus sp.]